MMKKFSFCLCLSILIQTYLSAVKSNPSFLDEINNSIATLKKSPDLTPLSYEEYSKLTGFIRNNGKNSPEKPKIYFLNSGEIFHTQGSEDYFCKGIVYTLPRKGEEIDWEKLTSSGFTFDPQKKTFKKKDLKSSKDQFLPGSSIYYIKCQIKGENWESGKEISYYLDKTTRQVKWEEESSNNKEASSSDLLRLKVFLLSETLFGLYHEEGYLGTHNIQEDIFRHIVNDKDTVIKKPSSFTSCKRLKDKNGEWKNLLLNNILYLSDQESDALRLWRAHVSTQENELVAKFPAKYDNEVVYLHNISYEIPQKGTDLPIANEYITSYGISEDASWFYVKIRDREKGGTQIYEYSKKDSIWAKRSKTLKKIIYDQKNPNIAIIKESDSNTFPTYSLRFSKDGGIKTQKILLHDTHPQDFQKERFSKAIHGWIPTCFEPEGHKIPVLLWLPPLMKEETFPLYVDIHGGPAAHARLKFNAYVQYWTIRGYAVLEVNYRGSEGYGKAWETALYGHAAEYDAEDVFSAISFLANNMNYLNKNRIYVGGGSYGAFIAATLISDPKKYPLSIAAVEMRCGLYDCANNREFKNDDDAEERLNWLRIYGANPNANEELNKSISPIHKIKNILTTIPILISHGEKDEQTLPEQAKRYIEALKNEKPTTVTSMIYPASGHGYKDEDEKDCFEKTVEFFENNPAQKK